MQERKLLEAYVKARTVVETLTDQLVEAKDVLQNAEANLVKAMEDNGITDTAKYEDLGRFHILKPSLRVSIAEGQDDDAFSYLEQIGESELIKRSVHWKTLSSLLGQKLDAGETLPECFSYYFQPSVRFEKP